MKSAYSLTTGTKVVLNRDVHTSEGRFYPKGMVGVVDAVYRKDGVERVFVMLDGAVVKFGDADSIDYV